MGKKTKDLAIKLAATVPVPIPAYIRVNEHGDVEHVDAHIRHIKVTGRRTLPDSSTKAPIADPDPIDESVEDLMVMDRKKVGTRDSVSGLSIDVDGNVKMFNTTSAVILGGKWKPVTGLASKDGGWIWYKEDDNGHMVPLFGGPDAPNLNVDTLNTAVKDLIEYVQQRELDGKSGKNHGNIHTLATFVAEMQIRSAPFKKAFVEDKHTYDIGETVRTADGKTWTVTEYTTYGVHEAVKVQGDSGNRIFLTTEIWHATDPKSKIHPTVIDMGKGYHGEGRFSAAWWADDGHWGILFNEANHKNRRTPEKALIDAANYVGEPFDALPVDALPILNPTQSPTANVPEGAVAVAEVLAKGKIDDDQFATLPNGKSVAFWALHNFDINWSDFLVGISYKATDEAHLSDKQARAVLNSLRKSFVAKMLPGQKAQPVISATPVKVLEDLENPLEDIGLPDVGTMAAKRRTGLDRTLEVIERYFPPDIKPGHRRVYVLTHQLPSSFKDGFPKDRKVVSRIGKHTLKYSTRLSKWELEEEGPLSKGKTLSQQAAKLKAQAQNPMNMVTDEQIEYPLRAIEIEVPIGDVSENADGTLTLKRVIGSDAITRIFDRHPREFFSARASYDGTVELQAIHRYQTHNPWYYNYEEPDKRSAYDKWVDSIAFDEFYDLEFPYMYRYGVKDGKAPSGSYMSDVWTNLASVTQPFFVPPMEVTGTTIEFPTPKGTPSKDQMKKDLLELPHVKDVVFGKDGGVAAVLDFSFGEWEEYGAPGETLWSSPGARWTLDIARYIRETFPGVIPNVQYGQEDNEDFPIEDHETLYVSFWPDEKKLKVVPSDIEVTPLRKELEMPNGETVVVGLPDISLEHVKSALFGYGITNQEELQKAYEASKKSTKFYMRPDVRVRTRIPEIGFREALKQGRFKSQFEVGASNAGGVYIPDGRAEAEYTLHGIPLNADMSHHPISGFLTEKEPSWGDDYDMFGNVEVVFKNDLKNRVTIVGGGSDSLSAGGFSGHHMGASPGSDVTWIDAVEPWATGLKPDTKAGVIQREVQVQGGLYASEIDYIIFPREPEEATLKLLKKYDIKYIVMEPDNPDVKPPDPSVADWYTPGLYMDYDGRKAFYRSGQRATEANKRVY